MAGGAHRARPGSRSRSDSAPTRTRGDARTPGGGTRSSRAAAAAALVAAAVGLGPLEAGAAGFPPRLPPSVTRPGSRGAAPAGGWGGAGGVLKEPRPLSAAPRASSPGVPTRHPRAQTSDSEESPRPHANPETPH